MRIARLVSILVVVIVSATLTLVPTSVKAATLGGSYSNTVCLNANSGASVVPFTNLGPSGKTWTLSIWLGLSGGDNLQGAQWYFGLEDHISSSNGQIEWRGSAYHWYNPFIADPMTLKLVGNLDTYGGITNSDTASQCYAVTASAYW